jgi:hypothetical protein
MVDYVINDAQIHELRQVAGAMIATGDRLMAMTDGIVDGGDTLLLARAIQGEGAGAFGDDKYLVGFWIANTAINLYEAPWQGGRWDTVGDVVKDRFHGYVNVSEPEPWAMDIARRALARERPAYDCTGGALAMLSRVDLKTHDWPERDDLLLEAFRSPAGHELRFYRTWAPEWHVSGGDE